MLGQYQSGAQTRRIKDLPDTGPYVELHPSWPAASARPTASC
ncbi:hypothetical protein [Nocardioides zeae]